MIAAATAEQIRDAARDYMRRNLGALAQVDAILARGVDAPTRDALLDVRLALKPPPGQPASPLSARVVRRAGG